METRLIAIVEDNPDILEAVSTLLDREDSFEVMGRLSSAEEALESLKESVPHILIVDISLPGMSGIELIRKVKGIYPAINILAFTGREEEKTILSAIKAGASGYLVKGSSAKELLEGIDELLLGGSPMSPRASHVVVKELQDSNFDDKFILSKREKDVLSGIMEGLSYTEIGDLLYISPHTVHSHIKRIFKKLKVSDRKEALLIAVKKGLL